MASVLSMSLSPPPKNATADTSLQDLLQTAISKHNLSRSVNSLITYLTFLNKLHINEHGAMKCRIWSCKSDVVHSESVWVTAIFEGCVLADQASRVGWNDHQAYGGWLETYGACQEHSCAGHD
jgi:hypothetical protein